MSDICSRQLYPVMARSRSQGLGCSALSVLACFSMGAASAQEPPQPPLPSFAELEAAGATIGEIHVGTLDVFDVNDPKENSALYRLANKLHIQTRPGVIERALLFKTGDRISVRLIEETERLLRGNAYLFDVRIHPVAYRDGVVDIEVVTRDTWTLNVGVNAGRSGGQNSSGTRLKDSNLFGTGITVGVGHSRTVDRSSNVFEFSNQRAFGTWTAIGFSHASNSDGQRNAASVVRPFYALDARWAAGASVSKDDRIDAVYSAGNISSQYRRRQEVGEAFAGWSAGLVDGWVQRYSLGVNYQRNVYAPEPGLTAPAVLPADEKLVGPFFRYELIEDRFDRELNRNLVGRPEFFQLGLASTVQLNWASTGLGSSRNALTYSGSIGRGFEPLPEHTLIALATLSGEVGGAGFKGQQISARAQYYLPQSKRWLFYASAAGDWMTQPGATDALALGGDNGLRGYPLRYQTGARRALFTVEQRFYTDWYPWHLFRVGGAAFLDVGRAWGGVNPNTTDPGWLANAGFGLRIVSVRASTVDVLHVDLAFPLGGTPDIKKVQFLVKTKTSF